MSEKNGKVRAVGVSTSLLTYMQERPGKVVTVDELLATFKYDRNQIMGNMYILVKKEYGIEKLQQGVWRYLEPDASDSGREHLQFEILKTKENGDMIGLDGEGTIYKITKVG